MGQYYQPTNLNTMDYLSCYDYDNGAKLMEHSYLGNNFMRAVEGLLSPNGKWYKCPLVWAGDYADPEEGTEDNIYTIGHKMKPDHRLPRAGNWRYIVNHTKKMFVDKHQLKGTTWIIHPLSLFTCEGNGRGGGDFHGEDSRIGTWARDIISVENHKPEGYEEIDGNFTED